MTEDFSRRLWSKIDVRKPTECWPFTGYLLKGYGRIGAGRRDQGVIYAHRAVCEIAHGPCPPGQSARHICGNRACCNPAHLAWGDQSANERDKRAHGRDNRGERHGMSRLTASDVLQIRELASQGIFQREIAARFGISQQHVSEIVTRKNWGWI